MLISFLFLDENICCGYSLEAPHRGASNEYPQHMFLSRNKKNNMWKPPLICSYTFRHVHLTETQISQSDQNHPCPHPETLHPWLSKLRQLKILIRLHECEFSAQMIFVTVAVDNRVFNLHSTPHTHTHTTNGIFPRCRL